MTRQCSDCPNTIGRYNKGGRCKACVCRRNHSIPENRAKRLDGVRKAWQRPGRKEAASRASSIVSARPDIIEARRESGKRNAHLSVLSATCLARKNSPEGRARMREKLSRLRYAEIPEKWLGDYRQLMCKKKMTRARALGILAERERAKLAAMSPFERQMHALQNGARLIEKPILRKADPSFTLGGVTDWAA